MLGREEGVKVVKERQASNKLTIDRPNSQFFLSFLYKIQLVKYEGLFCPKKSHLFPAPMMCGD